jgi:hypothetical protein
VLPGHTIGAPEKYDLAIKVFDKDINEQKEGFKDVMEIEKRMALLMRNWTSDE